MQDDVSQIGWSPTDVCYQPPWEARFLVLYLLFVFVLCIVKSVRLGRELWWFWPRRFRSLQNDDEDNRKANLLAASALANRRWSRQLDPSLTLRQLKLSESEFLRRWDLGSVEVGSMKRLMVLTLLLSTLGSLVLIVRSLTVISSQKISSGPALAGGMSEALVPVTTGVFVCVVLYAAACWFEWMLLRRRASWNYFYARVKIPPPATT